MAAEDQDSRTEEPTPERREKAQQSDETPESNEVQTLVVLIAALAMGSWTVPAIIRGHSGNLREWLTLAGTVDLTPMTIGTIFGKTVEQVVLFVLPMIICTAVASVAAQVVQVGFAVRMKRLKPKLGALNPLTGLKGLFSAESVVRLAKAALKLTFVGYVAYQVVLESGAGAEELVALNVPDILHFIGSAVFRTVAWVLVALVLVAVIDFAFQYYKYKQKLKMTKHEIKDQRKDREGDPQTKQRFFNVRQRLTRNQMLAAVPTADVVITNPVHVAVALRYVADVMRAPQLVAKGAGELAEQMKAVARRAGVPIIERRALARALFRFVKVGQEIPAELYRAVAEVLAYIYSIGRQAGANQGAA